MTKKKNHTTRANQGRSKAPQNNQSVPLNPVEGARRETRTGRREIALLLSLLRKGVNMSEDNGKLPSDEEVLRKFEAWQEDANINHFNANPKSSRTPLDL